MSIKIFFMEEDLDYIWLTLDVVTELKHLEAASLLRVLVTSSLESSMDRDIFHSKKAKLLNCWGKSLDLLVVRYDAMTNWKMIFISSFTCKVALLAHISPEPSHYSETLHTIQLASRIHRMRRKKMKLGGGSGGGSGSGGSSDENKRLGRLNHHDPGKI